MSYQANFLDLLNATSSPAPVSGLTHSDKQDGQMTDQSGQEAAPAPLSRQRGNNSNALSVAARIICATLAKPDISSAEIADVIATPTTGTYLCGAITGIAEVYGGITTRNRLAHALPLHKLQRGQFLDGFDFVVDWHLK